MRRKDSGDGRFGFLRHALAFAPELTRECAVNSLPAIRFAKKYGLDEEQTYRAAVLIKWAHRKRVTLAKERLALVVMLDPGLDDSDIAEMFAMTPQWAAYVRAHAAEIKDEQPIPPDLEDMDRVADDRFAVTPEELERRIAESRQTLTPKQQWRPCPSGPGIRQFYLGRHAFFPLGS